MATNPTIRHRKATEALAKTLSSADIYHWLAEYGYFPESYVLPPCYRVVKRPKKQKQYFTVVTKKGKTDYVVPTKELVHVHFPKTELTDRNFGLIHPELHNDIAFQIARNWKTITKALLPATSAVTSYSFPLPISSKKPGRVGTIRSGRMIYEFLGMVDRDLAAIAYRYRFLVRADIKSFYPSIYTHSIAWALHGKKFIRKAGNKYNYKLLGNRLDRLFQRSNDGCTNGIPIGPVVSDIIAEIVASAVDRELTKDIHKNKIPCEVIRFKDDYRILVHSEEDGRRVIKALQDALKCFNLEINEEKTKITPLPEGLFREWASRYHAVHPRKRRSYTWKAFRELYLAVLRIDADCPGTGVVDRFLADVIGKNGLLKVSLSTDNLQKVVSMLLLLARRRIKAFPKVLAIIEGVVRTHFGKMHKQDIVEFLENHLEGLSKEEARNKYLICWISYFLVSNDLKSLLKVKPKFRDQITRSVFSNRSLVFKDAKDHKIFIGCKSVGKQISMLRHLEVFLPPKVL